MCETSSDRCSSFSTERATLLRQRRRLAAELLPGDASPSRRKTLLERYNANQKRLMVHYKNHPVIDLPSNLVQYKTGNTGYATALRNVFDLSRLLPILHAETAHQLRLSKDGSLAPVTTTPFFSAAVTKPFGGAWGSAYSYSGRPEWLDHQSRIDDGNAPYVYDLVAMPGTKILWLESWEDYTLVCDLGKKTIPGYNSLSGITTSVKSLDYERLGVDALVMSDALVHDEVARFSRDTGYEHLDGWDLESFVVLNPDSFEYADVTSMVPATAPVPAW